MIAVTNGMWLLAGGLDELKRNIIFFDKISVVLGNGVIDSWRNGPYYKSKYLNWANELEFLFDTEFFLSSDNYSSPPDGINLSKDSILYKSLVKQSKSVWKEMNELGEWEERNKIRILSEEDGYRVRRLMALNYSLQTRVAAQHYRLFEHEEAVSLDPLPDALKQPARSVTQGDVLEMCVKRVPLPSSDTPWETIFEMKADKELSDRSRKLRLWTRELASSEMSAPVAEEYLTDLISDYENYMKLHTKKYKYGLIGTFLVGSSEVIEDFLKFKFSKILKRTLESKSQNSDLLIAEMEAPGREVSLISKLNEDSRFAV
jgi:hypothetical protein